MIYFILIPIGLMGIVLAIGAHGCDWTSPDDDYDIERRKGKR